MKIFRRIPTWFRAGAASALIVMACYPGDSLAAYSDCVTALRATCTALGMNDTDCSRFTQSEIFKLRMQITDGAGLPNCLNAKTSEEDASPEPDRSPKPSNSDIQFKRFWDQLTNSVG